VDGDGISVDDGISVGHGNRNRDGIWDNRNRKNTGKAVVVATGNKKLVVVTVELEVME
jgi:hypothetical protein